MRRAIVVAVGYGLFLALVTGSRVTSQSGSDFLFSSAVSLCMVATSISCLVVGLGSWAGLPKARRVVFCLFAGLCGVSFALDAAGTLTLLASVMMGLGLGCGYTLWGDMLARCPKEQIMVVPLLMTVFWGGFGAVLTAIDDYRLRMFPMMFFLIGSSLIYFALEKGLRGNGSENQFEGGDSNIDLGADSGECLSGVVRTLLLVIWQPMILTGVLGFSSGILRALTAMQGADPIVLSVARFSCAALVALIFLLWSKRSVAFETSPVALVLLLVAASAFMILPLVGGYYRVALASVVDVSYLLAGVFLSVSCAMASLHIKNSSMLACGLGQGISILLVTMGFSISTYLNLNPLSESFGEWVLALGVVYALFLIAIILSLVRARGRNGHQPKTIRMVISVSESSIRENFELKETYRISNREMDVLVLALTGRNAAAIAESLFLSESTVRTHLKHIYRKLDIHSKEELHCLVEKLVLESSS